ncbi:hypothetical protein D3H55_05090 [Bacillus salacetis]|uniref:Uncharacterized protein n=1 Tax=Bacillus salacetis TaxID=2315464 RepID=A0A3A1RAC0_9BACI|nr:hypothetical protein [Bacillus salacetis]RIW37412.1 hypothetical protein D3H55_05090 [Bacillus salacetis]
MFGFVKKQKLVKDDLKGRARLMYEDVSKDPWDQENLTKRNLDYSLESLRIVDAYIMRLKNREYDSDLLYDHFQNFVSRIGAYTGEVIKRRLDRDFQWYEAQSVIRHTSNHAVKGLERESETVLYSKAMDEVISPLSTVSQFLKGDSYYKSLLAFVEDMVNGR